MIAPQVEHLLSSCPFLVAHLDTRDFDLSTVVFGAVATALMRHGLLPEEEERVFEYFNALAQNGEPDDLVVLGTGAIELFNDDAAPQRLARCKLTGAALQMSEDFRVSWGQPDYGAA